MTWSDLVRPFEFEFFRNGLAVATVAGGLCGLMGVYVILRGMSYLGHGLSHAIFGGFAASSLVGVPMFVGAGLWGVVAALLVTRVTRRRAIGSDAAIGVISTGSFAVGLVLIQVNGSPQRNPDAVLFGNVLGVATSDIWTILGVAGLAVVTVFFRYRALLFTTFDPEVADASGLNTGRIDALLMLVLAASILATMTVMGVTLVAAAVVVPAAVARLLTGSFGRMLALSGLIGGICGFVGMNLSYHLDVASGPTIVLTGVALFVVVYGLTRASSDRPSTRVSLTSSSS